MNRRQRQRRARRRQLAVAAPAVLVATLYALGLCLPMVGRTEVRGWLAGSPQAVWAALTDLDGMTAWRNELRAVERLPDGDGGVRWRELRRGGVVALERVEATPPVRLVVRVAGADSAARRWIYQLREGGVGTELQLVEEVVVGNPLLRPLVRVFRPGRFRMERLLRDLEARLAVKGQVAAAGR